MGRTRLAVVGSAVCTAISLYGWWFHFSVGPAHGPGFEIGLIGAVVAVAALVVALR